MSGRRLDQYGCSKLLFTHVTQDLSKALLGASRVDIIITLHVQIPNKIIFTVHLLRTANERKSVTE